MLHSDVATYCRVVKMTLTLVYSVYLKVYFTQRYNNRPCLSYVICFVVALTLICNIYCKYERVTFQSLFIVYSGIYAGAFTGLLGSDAFLRILTIYIVKEL